METYKIKQVKSIESIDWNNIEKAKINHYSWTNDKKIEAYTQIVFIPSFGFVVKQTSIEKSPWAVYKNDGDPVCLDSTLEAFLKFNDEGYINLETNSIGTRLQGFGEGRHNRLSLLTFNVDAKRESDLWYVIEYIPLEGLKTVYKTLDISKIKEGFSFEGNFYKTGCNPTTKLEHYGMWNEIKNPTADFHRPEQFGKLIIE